MGSVSGLLGRSFGVSSSRGSSVSSELLRSLVHVAELESLLGVLVVVGSDDGLKNTLGLIGIGDLVHASVQAVIRIAESPKNQPNLFCASRDIVRRIVGVDDGQAIIVTKSLFWVSCCLWL
jgi:hypothetical protein